MRKIKNEKAITLIALVITIIVLLILAGVAISMLAGDNGILRKAAEAKEKTEQAQQNETEMLSEYEDVMEEIETGIPTVTEPPTKAVEKKTKYRDKKRKNSSNTSRI